MPDSLTLYGWGAYYQFDEAGIVRKGLRRIAGVQDAVQGIWRILADPRLAKSILRWETRLGIDRMCEDTWRWQLNNPNGCKLKGQ